MTDECETFADQARREGVLGIIRTTDRQSAVAAGKRLLTEGFRIVEVSMTTPRALEAVADLVDATTALPEAAIGVGTVLDESTVKTAAEIGAKFIVSPVMDTAVINAANERGLAAIPGCSTPTEMLTATKLGAAAVKIFPARAWTPMTLADILEPLPELRCIPTGGIHLQNVTDWLAAGAVAVGLGGSLTGGTVDQVRDLRTRLHRHLDRAIP